MNYKEEREKDVNNIKSSKHPRKVIVAGPGTGKSFLFKALIEDKQKEGKKDFIAITFIGKLGDALADDLCGLAKTVTMHGFAREFVLRNAPSWVYYPDIYEIIKEDLEKEGITNFQIGDENYKNKSVHYKAIGDADVVHYAVQMCSKDEKKIPKHDLILVDEFQDFNETEAEFINILSKKNEIVIVGDDDQALYEFKGSSPDHIRGRYHSGNADFESHTLRFCSRCTKVIIDYFHAIVKKFNLNEPAKNRIQKDYICYEPDKDKDSSANPKIHLIKECPVGAIAYNIQDRLGKITKNQKIKDVLIIGEGKSCKTTLRNIAKQLIGYGFKNVSYGGKEDILPTKQNVIDAYKFLNKDEKSLLGWRILGNPTIQTDIDNHLLNAKTMNIVVHGAFSKISQISETRMNMLQTAIEQTPVLEKDMRKNILVREVRDHNTHLSRPLGNLDITVCNILNSKGLGADIVFVIGFDEGKFPSKTIPTDSEIYQMLVALTRAKKRIYFINTIGKTVSSFIQCVDSKDLEVE